MHTGYGEDRLGNQTSMDMNQILESEGQVEDYFTADKNPFQQRGFGGGGNLSMEEVNDFVRPTVPQMDPRAKTAAANKRDPFGGAAGGMAFEGESRSSDNDI